MSEPLRALAGGPVIDVVDAENPWPGLESFEERYEKFFFGREREEKNLLRRVLRRRLTLLTGRSGMGKTSLLRAGLFPRLRREHIFPVYINLDVRRDGSSPDRQIFDAILEQAANAEHPVEAPKPLPRESIWEYLHRHEGDFWSHDNRLLTPLLVFDRFEDVLEAHSRTAGSSKELEVFLSELADLVEGRIPRTLSEQPRGVEVVDPEYHNYRILLSLREDFLADLEDWSDECLPTGLRNRMGLHPMSGERALDAVLGPGKELVEREVAVEIVRWVAGAGPKDGPAAADAPLERLTVEPALLSLVCRELNRERLSRKSAGEDNPKITAALLATGKTRIIEDFYTRCMTEVRPEVREFVEDRLLLPGPGGRRDSVALQLVPESFSENLKKLQELRLLRIETRDDIERIELTHDVLTAAVRASRDARRQREAEERIERERHAQQLQALNQQIAEADRKRVEIERERARERRFAFFLVLALIVLGAVGWVFMKLQNVQASAVKAQKGQATAEKEKSETDHLLAVSDFRTAANLVEDGRVAEGLAFLARAARATGPGKEEQDSKEEDPEKKLDPNPLGLAVRGAILDHLLRRNWPLPAGELTAPGRLLASVFDPEDRLLAVSSSGPKVRLWVEKNPGRIEPGREITFFTGEVKSADLSTDGRRLVLAAADGRYQLWDVGTPEPLGPVVQMESPLERIVLAPDGRTALALFDQGRLRFWDLEAGRALSPVRRHGKVANQFFAAEFSRDGRFAVTSADDFTAQGWAVPSGRPVWKSQHKKIVFSARFSADGRKVVTASVDGTAGVLNTRTGGSRSLRLEEKSQVVRWAEPSPDGRTVATASWDSTARLWDAATGRPIGEPMLHQGRVQSVRFSSDGKLLVTASSDGTARIWDARSGCPTHEPLNVRKALASAVFSPSGRQVLTLTQSDARLRLWDLGRTRAREAVLRPGGSKPKEEPAFVCQSSPGKEQTGPPGLVLNANPPQRAMARLSRQSNLLAVAVGSVVRLYRLSAERALTQAPDTFAPEGDVTAIALSRDGSRLAAAWNAKDSDSGRVRVWETATGRTLIDSPGGPVSSLDFSPDGRSLAAAWSNGRIDILSESGSSQVPLQDKLPRIPNDRLAMVRFSPDGQKLAAAYWDFTARIWNRSSGNPLPVTVNHVGRVFSVEFSEDGKRLITAAANGSARETDAASGAVLSNLVHPVSVWSAGFGSEAGGVQRIVTVAADGWVRQWEPTTGQVIGTPLDHPEPARAVAAQFLADGHSLVTVSQDGSVRLWDTPTAAAADSELLANLAQAVSGYRINKRGFAAFYDSTAALEELRRKSRKAPEGQTSALSLIRWFFTDPSRRTLSPLQPLRAQETAAP